MSINHHGSATAQPVIDQINAACDRIAPTWPLDRFIAVNPYWGWTGNDVRDAAASLGALGGTTLTMPTSWYRSEWAAGRLDAALIDEAAAAFDDPTLADRARRSLQHDHEGDHRVLPRAPLATDVRDLGAPPRPGQSWTDLVTHQISQHCAAHFDQWQGSWHPTHREDLYTSWRAAIAMHRGWQWYHGRTWLQSQLTSLPNSPVAAMAAMLESLGVPDVGREAYLTANLLAINGWAAWCAYERWQARLVGDDDHTIIDLLAIRLTWEWLLRNDAEDADAPIWEQWAHSWSAEVLTDLIESIEREQRVDWVMHAALEQTYQRSLIAPLTSADPAPDTDQNLPAVQAVFCIDVRSEVLRRNLEAVTREIETRGFAGFFGLPISYTPAASSLTRPQLPGLLAPVFNVTEHLPHGAGEDALASERAAALQSNQRWGSFRTAPSSMFSFVEAMGLLYGVKLVKESIAHSEPPANWEDLGLGGPTASALRPRLTSIDIDTAAIVAQRVLRAMGIEQRMAPLILLCGHGSQSANNPHAAGLDCGACGGHSGEVNARVAADLFNSMEVRARLEQLGTPIPPATWFVAGVHNTTTDTVELFDVDLVPDTHRDAIDQLRSWLAVAGDNARRERAGSLGLARFEDRPDALATTVRERANDWSQVRPEWGLAGNAAFIVAPRRRTRHMNLEGRTFLHDYDHTSDSDSSVLTLIMTAPMVVTNWINLQYFASTVDNRRYGSGNKVLHNVVGGHLGVFEGNGGDLRIGLPMQSLHDGTTLHHRPLRLSVFIEAPRHMIDAIVDAHEIVRNLVGNGWLHLLRIEPSSGDVERWTLTGWTPA
ncbi:MAG: YbcC family protein [Acidimicrobiia bacterium]